MRSWGSSGRGAVQVVASADVPYALQIKPLVRNADSLLAFANRVLGAQVTQSIVRQTFFKQFCGGKALAFLALSVLYNWPTHMV